MKKASRTRVRLGKLPQSVLADLLSSILEKGTFSEAQALVDLKISVENPLPDWAVQGVLISHDLSPKILQHVQKDNCAAAIVCSTWNKAWKVCHKEYFLENELPIQLPTSFNEVEPKQGFCVKGNSIGERSIVLRRGTKLYNVVNATSARPTFDEIVDIKELDSDCDYERALVASNSQSVYASTSSTIHKVCDGIKVKEVNALLNARWGCNALVCARDFSDDCVRIRQLLCIPQLKQVLVLICDSDTGNDHVCVFDEDLNFLYKFAEEEKDCQGMAFISNRLYLCLTDCDTIQSYSIGINENGERGRFFEDHLVVEQDGDWSQPLAITSAEVNGKRLFYLVEKRNNDNRPDDEVLKEDRGQCLIVMDESFNVLHRTKFLDGEEFFSGDLAIHDNCIFCTTEEEKGGDKVRNLRIFRVASSDIE